MGEAGRWIHLEREGGVATLTLDRPERANAYHAAMLVELDAAIGALEAGEERALLVMASGRSFCGGADLDEMQARTPEAALGLPSQRIFRRLARLPQVSIAVIHGAAVAGGLELALSCDLRLASQRAVFAMPETSLGIVPAAGGTQLLRRAIGVARAKMLILGGQRIDAPTALDWGLVGEVVPEEALADRARALAREIAGRDPLALRLAKAAIDVPEDDEGGYRLETLAQALLTARRAR